MNVLPTEFWAVPPEELLARLRVTDDGLTDDEARRRQAEYGALQLKPQRQSRAALLLAQFKSPIILILIVAAGLSFFLGAQADALIILTIILLSGFLGFWQEHGAALAVDKLFAMVQVKSEVRRDGASIDIPIEKIVPGDIICVSAGATVPGDCRLLEAKNLFIDEAALTGETYPAEKTIGVLEADIAPTLRTNSLFLGTHVISGWAKAVVVRVGAATEYGQISRHLALCPPETEFEQGVRQFGYLLLEITLMLVIAIFAVNVYLTRPIMNSFLFSLALAVGLTPQLLPAIISINLAHGAKRMARHNVIVKRLASIENFGSMNVLCTDKTGTLTEGVVRLKAALDLEGSFSEQVLLYAYLNATFESGFRNPLDEAIRNHKTLDISSFQKLDEEPYDFVRKRLSVLVSGDNRHIMITKGALANVLSACATAETGQGGRLPIAMVSDRIHSEVDALSVQGFRTLGLAYRDLGTSGSISKSDEADMVFLGFLVFTDPPKTGIDGTLHQLRALGISLKIITGDNRLVAKSVSRQVGLSTPHILTGSDLRQMSDEALVKQVNHVQVFAEIEPNQKERIIQALRKAGNVVGYMGDGINDASALRAADVGLSVNNAVDVAKEASDIVLLGNDLNVLLHGVGEGRMTFANTLKYVFMATSANFGNMFSMAAASLFLPFLPLLPKQILLMNLLTDIPEMTIATDNVDPELIDRPRRWNIAFIRKFMLTFGLISSVFDCLTFGVLLGVLRATPEEFRTGWLLESVISASVVVLVIRSRRPFFMSKPGKALLLATAAIAAITVVLPFTSAADVFGLTPVEPVILLALGGIVLLYVFAAELAKRAFYSRIAL